MSWLARLKKPETILKACPAETAKSVFAVSAGSIRRTSEKTDAENVPDGLKQDGPKNLPTTAIAPAASDADRWSWPHGSAMNAAEIEVFTQREHQFNQRGLAQQAAQNLAEQLVNRDREGDDRFLCLECGNLSRAGAWRCSQWQRAGLGAKVVPAELIQQLQRCWAFSHSQ
jgi:hypothetical protein